MSIETIAQGAKADITELHLKRKAKPQKGDSRYGKSHVTNGRSAHVEYVGHGKWARRWRDHFEKILAEFGSSISESDARRIATLNCELEKMEGLSACDSDFDDEKYSRFTDQLARLRRRLNKASGRSSGASAAARDRKPETPLGKALREDNERQQKMAQLK